MITNVKKKQLDQILGLNRFIVTMELFPFLVKRLMRNLFQGHFESMHYASLICIILREKCTPAYANGRFLVLFSSAWKKYYVLRTASIHAILLNPRIFILQRQGVGRWGWGGGG